jgi:hypothetical protein
VSIQCQACGNSDVRASHQKTAADEAEARKGQIAYRCRSCRTRFYSDRLAAKLPEKRHRSHRNGLLSILTHRKREIINASIFLVVLGLFFVCLLYLMNYHPENESRRETPMVMQVNA